jgi:hypothetical protein
MRRFDRVGKDCQGTRQDDLGSSDLQGKRRVI